MEISTLRKGNQIRIILQGTMDEKNAVRLRDHFRSLDLADIREVELDFAGVGRVGSAGIGKLLLFYKWLANSGGNLAVVNLPDPIFNLFNELKLHTLFRVAGQEFTA